MSLVWRAVLLWLEWWGQHWHWGRSLQAVWWEECAHRPWPGWAGKSPEQTKTGPAHMSSTGVRVVGERLWEVSGQLPVDLVGARRAVCCILNLTESPWRGSGSHVSLKSHSGWSVGRRLAGIVAGDGGDLCRMVAVGTGRWGWIGGPVNRPEGGLLD